MRTLMPTGLLLIVALVLAQPLLAAQGEPAEEPAGSPDLQAATDNNDIDNDIDNDVEDSEAVQAMPDIGLIEEEDNVIREDDENFVPSVRITEDLPVAFPVDI